MARVHATVCVDCEIPNVTINSISTSLMIDNTIVSGCFREVEFYTCDFACICCMPIPQHLNADQPFTVAGTCFEDVLFGLQFGDRVACTCVYV